MCKNRQCLFPKPCPNLKVDHRDYIKLLKELRDIPKVKKVFIRSGIRFDYVVADKSDAFLEELCRYHVSGQLKVAPEHVSDDVLTLMGKPENSVYQEFVKKYNKMNQKIHKDQYLVPYLMSSHPGSRMKDAVELAEHIRDLGYMPEQVQDFYPTPSTISTCMYYTGVDPRTMQPVYVPKNPHEKAMQRALIQYRDPKNYDLVIYIGNVENASNKVTNRLSWYTFWGNGNNVPWFAAERPVVFISLANPYHLVDVPMIKTFINGYSNSEYVIDSVMEKLMGRSNFTGKSPVDPFCGKEYLKW